MSEHKADELATGTHRAWVGETGSVRGPIIAPLRGVIVRAGINARDVQHSWLERAQPTNSRHAAITRSLNSWSSYKSWTEKVKHGWDKDKNGK